MANKKIHQLSDLTINWDDTMSYFVIDAYDIDNEEYVTAKIPVTDIVFIPGLADVLANGNETLGTDIIISENDKIINTDDNVSIELSEGKLVLTSSIGGIEINSSDFLNNTSKTFNVYGEEYIKFNSDSYELSDINETQTFLAISPGNTEIDNGEINVSSQGNINLNAIDFLNLYSSNQINLTSEINDGDDIYTATNIISQSTIELNAQFDNNDESKYSKLTLNQDYTSLESQNSSENTSAILNISPNDIQLVTLDADGTYGMETSVGNTTLRNTGINIESNSIQFLDSSTSTNFLTLSTTGIEFDAIAGVEIYKIRNLPTYANNADAISGGLDTNMIYKTASGELRIVV